MTEFKNKKVVIIDDEQEILDMLKDFLSEKGFNVITTSGGKEGTMIVKKEIPDLVITDLLLPEQHGLDVLKEIKDELFIPVIAISGIYKKHEIDKYIQDRFGDGFLEKPINLDKLYKLIKKILNE